MLIYGVLRSYQRGKLKELVSVCDKAVITEIDSRDDYLPPKKIKNSLKNQTQIKIILANEQSKG